jgi:hypothetical protein
LGELEEVFLWDQSDWHHEDLQVGAQCENLSLVLRKPEYSNLYSKNKKKTDHGQRPFQADASNTDNSHNRYTHHQPPRHSSRGAPSLRTANRPSIQKIQRVIEKVIENDAISDQFRLEQTDHDTTKNDKSRSSHSHAYIPYRSHNSHSQENRIEIHRKTIEKDPSDHDDKNNRLHDERSSSRRTKAQQPQQPQALQQTQQQTRRP